MFSKSEQFYDDIYSNMGKDYVAETDKLHEFIQKYKCSSGNALLDVACGTGTHAGLLNKYYNVEGNDLNAEMLKIARKKHPAIHFTQGDMRHFDLHRQFDIVTCLFSAIGYMTSKSDLQRAIKNMSNHLLPGGVLLVEPWFTPEQWHPGRVSTAFVDTPERKIFRMALANRKGKVSLLECKYLIGTSKGIQHIQEHHEFGLFTHEEYMNAMTKAGLQVTHEPEGVDGRGLYIGVRPS